MNECQGVRDRLNYLCEEFYTKPDKKVETDGCVSTQTLSEYQTTNVSQDFEKSESPILFSPMPLDEFKCYPIDTALAEERYPFPKKPSDNHSTRPSLFSLLEAAGYVKGWAFGFREPCSKFPRLEMLEAQQLQPI